MDPKQQNFGLPVDATCNPTSAQSLHRPRRHSCILRRARGADATSGVGSLRRAFTLLELLVVMTIIVLLASILLPSIGSGKETANLSKCLANLREICTTAGMYMDDEGKLTQPWHLGWNWDSSLGHTRLISEHVYGGFQTTVPHPIWGTDTDMYLIPTNARPYNKYIAPGLNSGPIGSYVCPSDKNNTTPNVWDRCRPPILNDHYSAYVVNGTSYAINWYWLESPPWNGINDYYGDINIMSAAGSAMLASKVGGPAAKFVLFMENAMNSYMLDARPRDCSGCQSCLQELGEGWHRKYSKYAMGMLDGHADYRYVDTRFVSDENFTIWAEPDTPMGF